MPSGSKLHVSFCESSNKSEPPIFEKQMEEKREKLLKKDERVSERLNKRPIHPTEHMADGPYKDKILKINQEQTKINEKLRAKHNDRIKREEGWDPEGEKQDPLVPTTVRK